jgi:hypothetical protein
MQGRRMIIIFWDHDAILHGQHSSDKIREFIHLLTDLIVYPNDWEELMVLIFRLAHNCLAYELSVDRNVEYKAWV